MCLCEVSVHAILLTRQDKSFELDERHPATAEALDSHEGNKLHHNQ